MSDGSGPPDGVPPVRPRRMEILSRHRAYAGFFGLDKLELRHERFGGGWTEVLRRELFCQRQAVAILPYDAAHDRVVLIEQFRMGAIEHADGAWVVEAPAGLVEPGEAPEEVARRELEEECGLTAGRMELALHYWASPGASTELVYVYVAEASLPESGGVHGKDDEGEDIMNHVLPVDEALAWLDAGRVTGVVGIVALQWLRQHRARLQRDWAA